MKYLIIIPLFISCTNTDLASLKALGTPGSIECYSGTKLIYSGKATGRIQTVEHSDGWEFQEEKTMAFIRVTGACVIRN